MIVDLIKSREIQNVSSSTGQYKVSGTTGNNFLLQCIAMCGNIKSVIILDQVFSESVTHGYSSFRCVGIADPASNADFECKAR